MPAYRVEPNDSDSDGLLDIGGGWKVTAAGGFGGSTTHGTKGAAVSAARSRAQDGEKIAIYSQNGKFQKTVTVGGQGGSSSGGGFGIGGGSGGVGSADLPDDLF